MVSVIIVDLKFPCPKQNFINHPVLRRITKGVTASYIIPLGGSRLQTLRHRLWNLIFFHGFMLRQCQSFNTRPLYKEISLST